MTLALPRCVASNARSWRTVRARSQCPRVCQPADQGSAVAFTVRFGTTGHSLAMSTGTCEPSTSVGPPERLRHAAPIISPVTPARSQPISAAPVASFPNFGEPHTRAPNKPAFSPTPGSRRRSRSKLHVVPDDAPRHVLMTTLPGSQKF